MKGVRHHVERHAIGQEEVDVGLVEPMKPDCLEAHLPVARRQSDKLDATVIEPFPELGASGAQSIEPGAGE
eukprot:1229431-Prymnesium_polylepis.1